MSGATWPGARSTPWWCAAWRRGCRRATPPRPRDRSEGSEVGDQRLRQQLREDRAAGSGEVVAVGVVRLEQARIAREVEERDAARGQPALQRVDVGTELWRLGS